MLPSSPLRFLLPVSLAVNAFLGALALMQWHRPPPPPPESMVEDMARPLPAADADLLRQSFARHLPPSDRRPPPFEDMLIGLRAALAADPFDPERLRTVFREGRAGRDRMDDAMEAAVVEAAARMSAAGRHRLAEWRPMPPPPR